MTTHTPRETEKVKAQKEDVNVTENNIYVAKWTTC